MVYIGEMSNLAFNSKIDKSVNLCIVLGFFFQRGAHYLWDGCYHGSFSDFCDILNIAVDFLKNQLDKE